MHWMILLSLCMQLLIRRRGNNDSDGVVVAVVVSCAGLPSPQSQVYLVSVADPNACDADPSTDTDRPVGVAVKDAVGGCCGAATDTGTVTLAVALELSVTVSFTE